MARTSLARKIRRIGMAPSTWTAEGKLVQRNYDLNVDVLQTTQQLTIEAHNRRTAALNRRQKPVKKHRRSKSRV